jgi:hypothetical protein
MSSVEEYIVEEKTTFLDAFQRGEGVPVSTPGLDTSLDKAVTAYLGKTYSDTASTLGDKYPVNLIIGRRGLRIGDKTKISKELPAAEVKLSVSKDEPPVKVSIQHALYTEVYGIEGTQMVPLNVNRNGLAQTKLGAILSMGGFPSTIIVPKPANGVTAKGAAITIDFDQLPCKIVKGGVVPFWPVDAQTIFNLATGRLPYWYMNYMLALKHATSSQKLDDIWTNDVFYKTCGRVLTGSGEHDFPIEVPHFKIGKSMPTFLKCYMGKARNASGGELKENDIVLLKAKLKLVAIAKKDGELFPVWDTLINTFGGANFAAHPQGIEEAKLRPEHGVQEEPFAVHTLLLKANYKALQDGGEPKRKEAPADASEIQDPKHARMMASE